MKKYSVPYNYWLILALIYLIEIIALAVIHSNTFSQLWIDMAAVP